MSSDKNRLIENYFKITEAEYPSFRKAAKYGTGLIILGSLLFYLQYIEVLRNINIISTVTVLLGVFSFWLWLRPFFTLRKIFYSRPADGDMDIWFLEDMHDIIVPRALDQLKINESSLREENIIIVPYPIYWAYPGVDTDRVSRKKGDDDSYTYTMWLVQILIVTDNFISYYSCVFDWLEDRISDERTNEYFFDDISSVRNDIDFIDYKFIDNDDQKIGNAKVFKLTNMSGDYLTIITDIPGLAVPETYTNNLERLVQALRVMLRHRRYGEEPEAKVTESEDENIEEVEFEVKDSKDEVFFHQQLRKIYYDYSKNLEEQKKAYREIVKE